MLHRPLQPKLVDHTLFYVSNLVVDVNLEGKLIWRGNFSSFWSRLRRGAKIAGIFLLVALNASNQNGWAADLSIFF